MTIGPFGLTIDLGKGREPKPFFRAAKKAGATATRPPRRYAEN